MEYVGLLIIGIGSISSGVSVAWGNGLLNAVAVTMIAAGGTVYGIALERNKQ